MNWSINQYANIQLDCCSFRLQNFLKEKIRAYTEKVRHQDKLADGIWHYLMNNAYLGIGLLESIASNVNISGRILLRRLRDECVSFQKLADYVKQDWQYKQLSVRNTPLKKHLFFGYNELSASFRAFKCWINVSPINIRQCMVYN